MIRILIVLITSQWLSYCHVKEKAEELKENTIATCNAQLENLSNIDNIDQFKDFLNIIKTKNCARLKEILGNRFYYSLDEATINFDFFKKERYLETNYKVNICDFLFEQKKFETIMFKETGFTKQIGAYNLISNANKLYIFTDKKEDLKNYEVTIQVNSCLKNGIPDVGLPTMINFNCDSKPNSKCIFEGILSWPH
ncbi:hypothetical protein [Leptospira kanakyensis]|uniref:hypothetical protein n=1 Tax=Leptospira kanakyensis TaxID=2484968 RepID=UPI00223E492C|nr:hypothetical protein [Leptospira kanakyensis]MCW7471778.1 hypothetical protein [Leptospira kanakyensis]